MKYKNVVVIPPTKSFGDTFSMIGLVYFLLEYYDNVYLYIYDGIPKYTHLEKRSDLFMYFNGFFQGSKYFNKRIYLATSTDVESMLDGSGYGDFHVCNVKSGNWSGADETFKHHVNVDPNFYFNDLNPIYNSIKIPKKYISSPNTHYPNRNTEINHLFYYKLLGLSNSVRMDFFNYERDLKKEDEIKKEILDKFNLKEGDKYNITNNTNLETHKYTKSGNSTGSGDLRPYINNDYPCIDMCNLVDFPGWLLTLVEGAEEIHLIEGGNVNFLYHCQYKRIMDTSKEVIFHIWALSRKWAGLHLDYAWKMMQNPTLDNWKFVYDRGDLNEN